MPIRFTPDLTRDYILSRVSEEEVFERYGVRVEEGIFRSPLRADRHPTCRFYRNRGGRLVLHDFAGHFHGDCFDLVQKLKQCNYPQALEDIAKTFAIVEGAPRTPIKSTIVIGPRTVCEIRISPLEWDAQHLEWWENYGVDIDLLNKFNVTPVKQVWLNGSVYYNRDFTKKTEVVFAYRFGGYDYKIYFPMRTERRFLHNNPDILQGWGQLPQSGDFVVITKALKDVICLRQFGIPAVAPMAETSVVSDSVLETLREEFGRVYALYDRDIVGKCALINLRKRGVIPMMMPKGTTKDFADLCKRDITAAKALSKEFINSIYTHE
jgi:hypothetical protein